MHTGVMPKNRKFREFCSEQKSSITKMYEFNTNEKKGKITFRLEVKDAANWTRWKEGVRAMAEGTRCFRPPHWIASG